MARATPTGTIGEMLDPDQLLLCEHDREPDECPICAAEEAEASFDPYDWVDATVTPTPQDVAADPIGVPFG
jgi:hypothetical protein